MNSILGKPHRLAWSFLRRQHDTLGAYSSSLQRRIISTTLPRRQSERTIEGGRGLRSSKLNNLMYGHTEKKQQPLLSGYRQTTPTPTQERLSKILSRLGYGSRRECESLLYTKRVKVNGQPPDAPGTIVSNTDVVKVDGIRIPVQGAMRVPGSYPNSQIYLVHKLPNELVTRHDPDGRPTIFSRLHSMGLPNNVIAVGRLDFKSEGLIVFTKDGALARYLEHPSGEFKRVYRVKVFGNPRNLDRMVKVLEKGTTIDGVQYQPALVSILSTKGHHSWLRIVLTEGKNREIKKLAGKFNVIVKTLKREQYGCFSLNNIPPGCALEAKAPRFLLRECAEFEHRH
eukprot:gb/GECG01009592.1/.p1 GENE.gb/GECG01009592.1/~~gb/GECG01009592.1/.p1  ORF type:complete len:341 (+),score=23.98 gb/GECG01009592.1/:1-1023(+)